MTTRDAEASPDETSTPHRPSVRARLVVTWVIVGALLIVILQESLTAGLSGNLAVTLTERFGGFVGRILFAVPITVVSFFVGGVLVGRLSPGETLREPGIACMVAIAVDAAVDAIRFGEPPHPVWIFFVAAIGYGVGMAGGWVGEIWQYRAERRRGGRA